MIITVTFNPSIDYIYFLDQFIKEGEHNRVGNPLRMVGGKGLNTARTLSLLKEEVLALAVVGGNNGNTLKNLFLQEKIPVVFFDNDAETRTSMTFMSKDTQTELVEKGPSISKAVIQNVENYLINICQEREDISCISFNGTLITDDTTIYAKLLSRLHKKLPTNIKLLMDLSEPLLTPVLQNSVVPYFIKPNIKELSDLVGQTISTKEDVISILKYHKNLKNIPFLLVSMGSQGAVAQINHILYDVKIPIINAINPTGSGDATVGGVCYSIQHQFSPEKTLKYAMACGMSNASHERVGFVEKQHVEKLVQQIEVIKI